MSRRAFILGLVIVGLLVFSLYRAKYGAKDTAAELMSVEAQIEDARHEKATLETELSHMSRREWIEEYARNELGMAPPQPEQMAGERDLDALVGKPVDPVAEEEAREAAEEAPQ
ncbi:MAG TPA: septum formation initiator family protein [Hyphomonas sp.]|nr:septum formation initiator family protein [Hyphomonas sp.]MCA8906014.1 septum formation initiator family protein [Hyphomonas sp.]MCB9961138.1 septum formation initiator family protein [Hyphomonas sp.]MCB9970429.1 septum formation initiator family protein [Hyphomonas sp.]HPE48807.1 septum formation initiator family protein [Hyphomonas sp.]